jgi:hypothetical protein
MSGRGEKSLVKMLAGCSRVAPGLLADDGRPGPGPRMMAAKWGMI